MLKETFGRIPGTLTDCKLFHTDRGMEFDNQTINEIQKGFGITRSLSKKRPYDNPVAKSTYKSVKLKFVHQYQFEITDTVRSKIICLRALVELPTIAWHVGL